MVKHKKIIITCDATCKIPDAHVKGRALTGNAACGVIIRDESEKVIHSEGFALGELTPPQAEYHGLIKALDKASSFCRGELEIWIDSELVIRQLNGTYAIRSENMKPLFDEVKKLERRFQHVSYNHYSRDHDWAKEVDQLANSEPKKRYGS